MQCPSSVWCRGCLRRDGHAGFSVPADFYQESSSCFSLFIASWFPMKESLCLHMDRMDSCRPCPGGDPEGLVRQWGRNEVRDFSSLSTASSRSLHMRHLNSYSRLCIEDRAAEGHFICCSSQSQSCPCCMDTGWAPAQLSQPPATQSSPPSRSPSFLSSAVIPLIQTQGLGSEGRNLFGFNFG